MAEFDADEVIAQAIATLTKKYPGLSTQEVEDAVRAEFAELQSRPVQDFIQVLTEKGAKKRLKIREQH